MQGFIASLTLILSNADRPDGPRYPIVQELVGLREQYTSHTLNSTVALVLAAQRSDDLTWVLDYCKETCVYLFSIQHTRGHSN